MVYFRTIPTVWYILELFRQCGIFWNYSDSVVYFGTVPTVWYILELFRQCGIFWNYSDSVVYFVFHFCCNRIDGVMVSLLDSNTIDSGFESRSGQTKVYNIGMYCLSAKQAE